MSSFFTKMKMRGKFQKNKKSIIFEKKEKYIQNKFCLLNIKICKKYFTSRNLTEDFIINSCNGRCLRHPRQRSWRIQ